MDVQILQMIRDGEGFNWQSFLMPESYHGTTLRIPFCYL